MNKNGHSDYRLSIYNAYFIPLLCFNEGQIYYLFSNKGIISKLQEKKWSGKSRF